MLVIREDQLEALREAARHRFDQAMVGEVQRRCSHHARTSPEMLLELVTTARRRARHYGLWQRADIRGFILLAGRHGADVGTTPATRWASEVLEDPRLQGDEKLQRLAALEPLEGERVPSP
ncbi:MAG: hypothetical protein ACRBN8_29200 [Nannocystales bacterium]